MMKKTGYVMAVLLLMTSCSEEELLQNNQFDALTLTAHIVPAHSRVEINPDNGALTWGTGDAFYAFDANNGRGLYTLEGSGGTTTGAFKVNESDNHLGHAATRAVFPAKFSPQYGKDKKLHLSIADYYGAGAKGNSQDAPMYGTIDKGVVNFQHLTGILKLDLQNLPLGYNKVVVKGDGSQALAGDFVLEETGGVPVLVPGEAGLAKHQVGVSTTFGNLARRFFYMPLPAGVYAQLEVYCEDSKGLNQPLKLLSWQNKTIKVGNLYSANRTIFTGTKVGELKSMIDQLERPATIEVLNAFENNGGLYFNNGNRLTLNFQHVFLWGNKKTNFQLCKDKKEGSVVPESLTVNLPMESTMITQFSMDNMMDCAYTVASGVFYRIGCKGNHQNKMVGAGVTSTYLKLEDCSGRVAIDRGAKVNTVTCILKDNKGLTVDLYNADLTGCDYVEKNSQAIVRYAENKKFFLTLDKTSQDTAFVIIKDQKGKMFRLDKTGLK